MSGKGPQENLGNLVLYMERYKRIRQLVNHLDCRNVRFKRPGRRTFATSAGVVDMCIFEAPWYTSLDFPPKTIASPEASNTLLFKSSGDLSLEWNRSRIDRQKRSQHCCIRWDYSYL